MSTSDKRVNARIKEVFSRRVNAICDTHHTLARCENLSERRMVLYIVALLLGDMALAAKIRELGL